ncbi:hypothetical protein CDAR_304481 [Caerostris darwini]|uniref:Uncharacterized protein n=1 Tax=Caerostris darwini TaxID=1538125 RepID=A0AAV4NJS0_9ARAC|nr:hypothetical protein CDAR_304481 [Caerostris darwini]
METRESKNDDKYAGAYNFSVCSGVRRRMRPGIAVRRACYMSYTGGESSIRRMSPEQLSQSAAKLMQSPFPNKDPPSRKRGRVCDLPPFAFPPTPGPVSTLPSKMRNFLSSSLPVCLSRRIAAASAIHEARDDG